MYGEEGRAVGLSQDLKRKRTTTCVMIEFTMHPWMRACFLADATGLGKTWIIALEMAGNVGRTVACTEGSLQQCLRKECRNTPR